MKKHRTIKVPGAKKLPVRAPTPPTGGPMSDRRPSSNGQVEIEEGLDDYETRDVDKSCGDSCSEGDEQKRDCEETEDDDKKEVRSPRKST